MAGPTRYNIFKNGRAQDVTLANNDLSIQAVGSREVRIVVDSDNVSRGESVRALETIQQHILQAAYPPFVGGTRWAAMKNGTAEGVIRAQGIAAGTYNSGVRVVADTDNMDRGDLVRAIVEVKEAILEGKYPAF